jgi:hypothetical protein
MPNGRPAPKRAPRISLRRKGRTTDLLIEGATALLVCGTVGLAVSLGYLMYLYLLH